MSAEIILAFISICTVLAAAFWALLLYTQASNEKQKRLSEELKNPEVRAIILQLVRNQYCSSPKTVADRRANSRRALAMIRLKKVVKDPSIRKQIYKLTDTQKNER